jgi:hypothetical protein
MTRIAKLLVGAGAAAMLVAGAASPADAQYYRYRPYRHDNAAGIVAGIAVLGGIAAIASAANRDRAYGYGYDTYRSYYSYAVNACGAEAQRIGRGRVRIDEVNRVGGDRYRVTGSVDGYDRYGYDRYDRYYGGYRSDERFTCFAFGNGRIQDFRFSSF